MIKLEINLDYLNQKILRLVNFLFKMINLIIYKILIKIDMSKALCTLKNFFI